MKSALIFGFALLPLVACGDTASAPWPRAIREFPPGVPASVTYGAFRITIREPRDPTARAGGGSGGPMLEYVVRKRAGWTTMFYSQNVGTRLLEPFNGYPQLEIWGRGGGGSWSRVLMRFERGQYRHVRIDEFTNDESRASDTARTARRPDGTHKLFFVETRIPD